MKKNILLSILSCCFTFSGFAQSDLEKISSWLENGIFVRSMRNDFIDSEQKGAFFSLKKKDVPINIPKPKTTYNFFRFSELTLDSSSTNERIYLGIAFMSHTYFEAQFDSLFSSTDKFRNCTNGYYMFCKIFQTRGGKPKINVYPDFNNYCIPKQHNKVDSCSNINIEGACNSLEEHLSKLKILMRIRDFEAEDLWKSDKIDEENKKVSCEYKINFEKFIKCFQINFDSGSSIIGDNNFVFKNNIVGLTLDYTKYGKSTDKTEQTRYSYDYRCYSTIQWMGTYNAFIGSYKSINRPNESELDGREAPLSYEKQNDIIDIVNVKNAPFGCIDEKTHTLERIYVDKNRRGGWVFAGNFGNFRDIEHYILLTNPILNNNQFSDFITNKKSFKTLKNIFLYDTLPLQKDNEAHSPWKRGKEINIIDKNKALKLKGFQICEDKISNKLSIWLEVEF